MKILIDSYSNISQNICGGVRIRIEEYLKNFNREIDEVKVFDKWNDKIEEYDVYHVFLATMDSYSTVKLAKQKGLKVVVSATMSLRRWLPIFYGRIVSKIFRQLTPNAIVKKIYDMADAIICETENEKNFISKAYNIDSNKLYVIANGINSKRNDATEQYFREKTDIQGKFVLQVGRFDANKNQMSMIEAVRGTDIQLVFIGGPDSTSERYYEKCKELASENVHFLGWIDHEDVLLYSAYAAAHVVVVPSHHETFGFALFEGGIYGCNLVVTDVLPVDSWGIDDYCFTVKSKDVSDIRKKVQMAYNAEKNDKISKIIEKNFSWKSVVDQHIELYERLLNKEV